ncbi:helix-turn-helix transcriptional regulator [Aminomonas paucivorans]|uniref:YheO domain protein n=1 Tax=Aminomonas paucivorans DSM 12260 TaxID=584708 RepID=E3CX68_9BACT|nr:PAS domain-containing protein [Aminomonas paucivorans]EFQ24415.1 YheO domain protein [Aminomonas paucivorans DSM 12260]
MLSTKADEILRFARPLVDFLGDVMGEDCEVVLHDLRDPERSILAIRNGQVTGRSVGDSVTDYALEVLRESQGQDYRAHYPGRLAEGGKALRLSSLFLRDDEGRIVGMLSLNQDLSRLREAHETLGRLLSLGEVSPPDREDPPIHLSIENLMNLQLERAIRDRGVEPGRMTVEEKRGVVEELDRKGIFLLRGAVGAVARRLEVSEQTVYRYLRG